MSRLIVGAVIVLLVVVGGIFLLVGTLNGGDSDTGSLAPTRPAASVDVRLNGA